MIINGNLKFHTGGAGEVKSVMMENFSTAARDALTGATERFAGRIIYNTTTNAYNYFDGTAGTGATGWVAFGSSGAVGTLQTEVDAIETSMGTELMDGSGVFNTGPTNALGNVTGAMDLFDVLEQLDSAITTAVAIDTLGEMTDTTSDIVSGGILGDILYISVAGTTAANTGLAAEPNDGDLLQWTSGDTWDAVAASSIGGNAFETITTDVGTSIVADQVSDTMSLLGGTNSGIQTSATADDITLDFVLPDLATGSATLALGDFIAVSDSADAATVTAQKYTFTDMVVDLDIPNAITADGILVRTAADTYTSRTIFANGAGANAGITISDGDGVAAAPGIGFNLTGLPAITSLASIDEFVVFDAAGTANKKITLANLAGSIGGDLDLGELNNVTDGTTSGHVMYADSGTTWATALPGSTSNVQAHGDALDDFNVIGVTTAADQMYYSTAAGALALTTITSVARDLLDDATVGDQRTTLGLVAGGTGDIWLEKAGDTMSGALDMGSQLITNVADPVSGTDAANKNYVDATTAGLSWKNPAKAASTANLTLSGTQTVDGIALIAEDRVLVKDQTNTEENGIYVVKAGAWVRSDDMDSLSPIDEFNSAAVFVQQGTLNSDIGYTVTSTIAVVDTDAVTFAAFTGAASVVDGVGLTFTGNVLDVNLGAGIFALPADEVGIELNNATTSAIILTTDGTTRSTDSAGKLELLLATVGGLEQDADGLRVDVENTTTATVAVADSLLFTDATNANVPSKTTVTNFIQNLDILTNGAGDNPLLATDGVRVGNLGNSIQIELDIGILGTGGGSVGADLMVFNDDSTGGNVHIARTVTDFLADHNIATTASGGAHTASNGVELTANDFAVSIDSLTLTNPVIGADLLIFDDGAAGTNAGRTFTNMLADLDVVNLAFGAGGLITQTTADTYVERSIVANTDNDLRGLTVVNGDGVAGNPTIGLDIDGTGNLGTAQQNDKLIIWEDSFNVNKSITVGQFSTDIGGMLTLSELGDTTNTAPAEGNILVYNGSGQYDPVHTHFVSTQASSTSWTVTHNLNQKFVQVTVYDSSDNVIIPQTIVATSSIITTITFNTAIAGTAVCSGVVGADSESV